MTWGAEVAHIMRKDLRELRWMVGGYLVVVALATASAVGLFGAHNYFEAGVLFVVGMGIFLLASFVQADSPTRPDAFWALHPHRPSAMMAAKVVAAVIVIMLPALIGQYAALSVLAADASTTWGLLADSAGAYGAWLMLALVLAAITPDLRTFILVLIATPIVLLIATGLFFQNTAAIGMNITAHMGSVSAIGGLLLVMVLYRTRSRARRTWIAAAAVVVCSAFTIFGLSPLVKANAERSASPLDTASFHFSLDGVHQATGGMTGLEIRVSVDHVREGERITFTPTLATIDLVDGGHFTVSVHRGELLVVSPEVALGGGISAAPNLLGQRLVSGFTIDVVGPQGHLEARDLASVTVQGNASATTATVVGSMPLRRGASFANAGTRVAVDHIRTTPDTVIALNVRSIPGASTRRTFLSQGTGFGAALVDTSRRTARMLFNQGSFGASGNSGVVLPGDDITNEAMLMGVTLPVNGQLNGDVMVASTIGVSAPTADERADAAWLKNAVVTLVRWTSVGSYRVSARIPVKIPALVGTPR